MSELSVVATLPRRHLDGPPWAPSAADSSPTAWVGTAAALDPSLRPGALLVATELLGPVGGASRPLPGAALLAEDLGRAGLVVRPGPLARRGSLSTPSAALAVELDEAGWDDLMTSAGPLAVLRAIVGPGADAAPARVVDGAVRASLERWAQALGTRRVLLAAPRSFCAGVERAIEIVERALARFGSPVYVRRQIVHNAHVVQDLEAKGAIFVTELDEVPDASTVILAAHGVAPEVRDEAEARGSLNVIDATCPLVAKVHHQARRFAAQGHQIVLIGHGSHEEIVGTMAEAPDEITLVEGVDEVEALILEADRPVAYLTQTTLATDETAEIIGALERRYPSIIGPAASDICYATQNRQDAVRAVAEQCDLLLVVGSANSSNATRLCEVGRRHGCRAELVEDARQLRLEWLAGARVIGLTAGASTPEHLVREVLDALRTLGPLQVDEHAVTQEHAHFPLPQQVR